jgi:hypothetical protein
MLHRWQSLEQSNKLNQEEAGFTLMHPSSHLSTGQGVMTQDTCTVAFEHKEAATGAAAENSARCSYWQYFAHYDAYHQLVPL